jgi:hypothetical protein
MVFTAEKRRAPRIAEKRKDRKVFSAFFPAISVSPR